MPFLLTGNIYKLAEEFNFDGKILKEAIRLTFEKRKTSIPNELPLAFTKEFFEDPAKQNQWSAFTSKNSLRSVPFASVIEKIKTFIEPVFLAINNSNTYDFTWNSGKHWTGN